MKEALYVGLAVIVVAFFIVRQRRSDRFRERSLLFPLALGVYGAVLLTHVVQRYGLGAGSLVLLLLSATASIAFGVIRGSTIELSMRGDELWERASWRTIGIGWGGLVGARIGLIGLAGAIGAKAASSPASIPLMLAITIAAQMLVVTGRARELGVVSQPRSRRLDPSTRRRRSDRFS